MDPVWSGPVQMLRHAAFHSGRRQEGCEVPKQIRGGVLEGTTRTESLVGPAKPQRLEQGRPALDMENQEAAAQSGPDIRGHQVDLGVGAENRVPSGNQGSEGRPVGVAVGSPASLEITCGASAASESQCLWEKTI